MAIGIRGAPPQPRSVTGTGTSASIAAATLAALTAVGDLLLAVVDVGAGTAVTHTLTPSHTQRVGPTANAASTGQINVYTKTAVSGDISTGNVSGSLSAARQNALAIMAFFGATYQSVSSITTETATSSVTIPSVTPPVDDCLLVAITTANSNTSNAGRSFTPPAGWTEQQDIFTGFTTGFRAGIGIFTKQLTGGAGVATGTATITASGNVDAQTIVMVLSPSVVNASTSDAAGGTDTVTRALSTARGPSDAAAGTDTVARTSSRTRATSDAGAGTDAVTRTSARARATADTAAATDSVSASLTSGGPLSRSTSDSAPASDTVARSSTRARGVSDTGAGTDTLARVIHLTRAVTDAAGGHDTVTAVDPDAGSTGTIAALWWDGVAEQPGTLDGWWDGDTVQPAVLEGWWDGAAVQPVA